MNRKQILLLIGSLELSPRNFSSVSIVLPAMYLAMGLPPFFVSLFMPLVMMGMFSASTVAPWFIKRVPYRENIIGLDCSLRAAIKFAIGLMVFVRPTSFTIFFFVFVGYFLGFLEILEEIVYEDIVGSSFLAQEIAPLYRRATAISGLLTIGICTTLYFSLPRDVTMADTPVYVWAASLVFFTMYLLSLFAKGTRYEVSQEPVLREWKLGWHIFRRTPWFQKYILIVCLFVPTSIAAPFYTIHAHYLGLINARDVVVLIIAYSMGAVAASQIWRTTMGKDSQMIFVTSGFLSVLCVILVICFDRGFLPQSIYLYCTIYFLLSLAYNGGISTAKIYLTHKAKDEERTDLFSIYNTVFPVVASISSLILGSGAHMVHPLFAFGFMGLMGLALTFCAHCFIERGTPNLLEDAGL